MEINLPAIKTPLNKWYYRMEQDGILFPTYFDFYYSIKGITPIHFVFDDVLGYVELQETSNQFLVFDTEHRCIEIFLQEQWDRGHYMNNWDMTNTRHKEIFNIFMESYAHKIMTKPTEPANLKYIEMEKLLTSV